MKRLSGLACAVLFVFAAACARTDAGITSMVKSKFAADETVKAYQVNVDTHDHIVTLTGTVDSPAAKARAMLLAREADGVKDVIDNITVNDAVATSGRSDAGDAAAEKIREGADATADGIHRGADATAHGIQKGADATAHATRDAGHAVEHKVKGSDVDDKVEAKAKEGSNAVVDGAKKVGNATKKGAEAVADGAKKVGSEVKDAVTDDDPDTNKDGK